MSLNDLSKLPNECAYCGSADDLTKEHVIPRSFEAENAPNWEPIIVWACSECNNAKSALDSRVRELFAVDLYGGEHETAQKLLAGKIKRSIVRSVEKGHRNPLLELLKSMKPDRIVGPDGAVIAEGMGGKLTDDPITPWFHYVIKGITMALYGQRLSEPFQADIGRYYPDSYSLICQQLSAIGAPAPVPLGTHTTFTYRGVDDAPPGFGVWVFQFYGGVVFMLFVVPEGMEAEQQGE